MLNERGCRGGGRAGEEGREKRGGKREKKGREKEERERGNGEKRREWETDTPCTLPLKQRGQDTIQIEPSLFFLHKSAVALHNKVRLVHFYNTDVVKDNVK